MKKWIKYLIITGCIALFLFLMLPFLTTPSLESGASQQVKQAAKPQIFTSNPLTSLVERIAKLFSGKKNSTDKIARNNRSAGSIPNEELFSPVHSEGDDISPTNITGEATGDAQTPKNVYVVPVDDNVEWVLIQQHTPEDSPSGMHEVNVKDDAYTRYVKQERLARTAPAPQTATAQEVPDSKLAKLFRPITRLFGRKETPAAGPLQTASADTSTLRGRKNGTSDPLNRNQAKQVRNLPRAKDVHRAFGDPNKSDSSYNHSDKFKLNDLINPTNAIQQAAHLVADSVYPNSSSQQNQDLYQDQQQNYQQTWNERLQAHLLALSEGAEPVDRLGKTITCHIAEGLITNQVGCSLGLSDDDIAKLRATNRALFEERTGIPLPQTKLTPILGVADANTLEQIISDEFDDQLDAETKEIYRFMLKNSNCSHNNCYWVANSLQREKTLEQSVNASGVDFAGDPQHKYDQISAAFVQDKLASLPPDSTDEQKEQVRTQPQRASTPYVLYEQQDVDNLVEQIQSAPADDITTLYVASAPDTLPLVQRYPDVPVLYGKQALSLTGDDQSTEDRAAVFTNDYIDSVLFARDGVRRIEDNATQQAVKNGIAPVVQKIKEEMAKGQEPL